MGVLLPIHIVGATLGILAGSLALVVAKGRPMHRKAGTVFVYAMLTMCISAGLIAVMKVQLPNIMASILTSYLVVTALTTVRPPSAAQRRLEIALTVVASLLSAVTLAAGFYALTLPRRVFVGAPAPAFFIFGIIALIAVAGDVRVLRRGPLRGARRLARHLWRMCWALWIAVASFLSIRSRAVFVFGERLATPTLRITLVLLPLILMVYWLWRVRGGRANRLLRSFSAEPSPQSSPTAAR